MDNDFFSPFFVSRWGERVTGCFSQRAKLLSNELKRKTVLLSPVVSRSGNPRRREGRNRCGRNTDCFALLSDYTEIPSVDPDFPAPAQFQARKRNGKCENAMEFRKHLTGLTGCVIIYGTNVTYKKRDSRCARKMKTSSERLKTSLKSNF